MPSRAFKSFEYNVVDVDRLISSHGRLKKGTPGKEALGHITRSGVVMLCASWELYVEMLLRESARYYTRELDLPSKLPTDVQRQLSQAVKTHKHELRAMDLAGDGWKAVYLDLVGVRTESLNTPKTSKLVALFADLIGIADISNKWSLGTTLLDDFVTSRGDIAHRGRHAAYITIGALEDHRERIRQYAVDTDNSAAEHLRTTTPRGYKPWNQTS